MPCAAGTVTLAKRLVSMDELQEQFDDATFAFSQGDYGQAAAGFEAILAADENHFDARMSLSMTLCRLEQYERAIEEGHRAEKLRPNDQLVHTNLSLFYVKIGNKKAAEHHGLQSKIASWKQPGAAAPTNAEEELQMAQPKAESFKLPGKFPDMPWRKNRNKGQAEGAADE
ncbi:MAG: tetratricopeptide repeat protein [Verrucomicrobiota bacterium]|nr:tetratricopeptide repeat protein [Verrucomicrobiota bacterium]